MWVLGFRVLDFWALILVRLFGFWWAGLGLRVQGLGFLWIWGRGEGVVFWVLGSWSLPRD